MTDCNHADFRRLIHTSLGGILSAMESCSPDEYKSINGLLYAYLMLAANSLLYVIFITCSFGVYAASGHDTQHNEAGVIDIRFSEEGCSLTAEQALLVDILHELGKAAGFKLITFEELGHEQQDWEFQPMPLTHLLDNLLRGYGTVMLYEKAMDGQGDNNKRRLKELWLIAREGGAGPDGQSNIDIDITLEQEDTPLTGNQNLTPEQQYEISYIENLEGLTGDDVIETLKQTLVDGKDLVVRKRAVTALGDIGGIRVLDALESGMGDRSGEVRTELAKTFAGIKHQRSMLLLGQMIVGDHDAGVRRQAVRSLYQQKSPAARAFVEAALKDKDDSVRKVADEVLLQWGIVSENQ